MLLNQAWVDEWKRRAGTQYAAREGRAPMGMSEEWEGAGRRVEAHLALIEREVDGLRELLAQMGFPIKRQRIRITAANGKAAQALAFLQHMYPYVATPKAVAAQLSVTSTYAYDLLSSLVSEGLAEKVRRGAYKAVDPVDLSGD